MNEIILIKLRCCKQIDELFGSMTSETISKFEKDLIEEHLDYAKRASIKYPTEYKEVYGG